MLLFSVGEKGNKIKRDTMISDYEHGGLKMIDEGRFARVLKSTCQMKWSVDCSTEQNESVNWAAVYRKPFQFTKI